MADTYTPNYTFVLVEVGASRDTWGSKENTNWTSIDTQLKSLQDQITTTNLDFKAWLPIGTIVAWHTGSSGGVPAGWAICDGRVVPRSDGGGNITTPNLLGRFLLADSASGGTGGAWTASAATDTQGYHSHGDWTAGHALTIAEMPTHTHTYSVNTTGSGSPSSGSKQTDYTTGNTGSTGGNAAHNHQIYGDGSHAHNVTVSIVPQYFRVIFIMRV